MFLSGCTWSGHYNDEFGYDEEYGTGITRDNWSCTNDCSGHEAGYEWAEESGIDDPYNCGGNSQSFIEGCEAYANEQMMGSDEEYDENEEEYSYY